MVRDMNSETTVWIRMKENIIEMKKTWILSFFYIFNGVCSISALNFISIPIYLAGRRCNTLFAVLVKLVLCESVDWSMVIASLLITISALLAM